MNLLQQFQQHVKQSVLFQPADGILLAISGGVDSVVLAHLCHASGFRMEMAHMNFGLRGEESIRDENFVRQMADHLAVPLYVQRVDTTEYARENKLSIQETARILRYNWFRELLQTHNQLQYLCTAHHADDNVETVLMNLFRGTGIGGLKGILPKQDVLIRPLLFFSRKDIEVYAAENHLSFVEDSSNKEEKYSRNFFRLQVIPLIEKVYPAAVENMRHNIDRFRDVEQLYLEMSALKKKKLLVKKDGEWQVPVEKLRHAKPLRTIVYEVFSSFNFSSAQTIEIIGLMDSETGRYMLSPTHRLLKNRNWFIITPLQKINNNIVVINEPLGEIVFDSGKISFSEKPYDSLVSIPADPMLAWVDSEMLVFPLIIRKWKVGDYFYPLGMRKKKKLSRFFIDRKMSIPEKENTWILESGGRVVWVIGQRIDDRFKIQSTSKKITCLQYIKHGTK